MPPLPDAERQFIEIEFHNNLNSNVVYDRFAPPFAAGNNRDPAHLAEANWMSAMDDNPNDTRRINDNGVERWLTPFYVYHRKTLRYLRLPNGQSGRFEIDPNTRVPGGRTKLATVSPYFNVAHQTTQMMLPTRPDCAQLRTFNENGIWRWQVECVVAEDNIIQVLHVEEPQLNKARQMYLEHGAPLDPTPCDDGDVEHEDDEDSLRLEQVREKVVHTHSEFSLSAVHWMNKDSKTIT